MEGCDAGMRWRDVMEGCDGGREGAEEHIEAQAQVLCVGCQTSAPSDSTLRSFPV